VPAWAAEQPRREAARPAWVAGCREGLSLPAVTCVLTGHRGEGESPVAARPLPFTGPGRYG
jgi:hypothetical protein